MLALIGVVLTKLCLYMSPVSHMKLYLIYSRYLMQLSSLLREEINPKLLLFQLVGDQPDLCGLHVRVERVPVHENRTQSNSSQHGGSVTES